MTNIYMSQSGIDKLNEEIRILKDMLSEKRGFNPKETIDGYNPELAEIYRERSAIENLLYVLEDKRSRAILIERESNSELVDLDDIVTINFADDGDELTFKLVGEDGNTLKEIPEISINSPLGRSVYKKSIGTVCTYVVNGQTMSITISNKLNLNNTEDIPTR